MSDRTDPNSQRDEEKALPVGVPRYRRLASGSIEEYIGGRYIEVVPPPSAPTPPPNPGSGYVEIG